MLLAQQSVQHVQNVSVVMGVIAVATMVYWRLMLRLLLALIVVSVIVGAVALVQIMH
jgi:hypothetical protein